MKQEKFDKEMRKLYRRIGARQQLHYFDKKYIGASSGYAIGSGRCDNTPFSRKQLEFALITSKHPIVKEILETGLVDDYENWENFIANGKKLSEKLEKNLVLKGVKILDLGCGYIPSFARCSRKLGAEVYTVDLIPSEEFEFDEEYFSQQDRDEEINKHIKLDLWDPNSLEKITQKTKSNFDLMSSAHLSTSDGPNGHDVMERFAPLLKKDGIYFDAMGNMLDGKVYQK